MRPLVRGSMPAFIAFMYSMFMSFTVGAESFIVNCCCARAPVENAAAATRPAASAIFFMRFLLRKRWPIMMEKFHGTDAGNRSRADSAKRARRGTPRGRRARRGERGTGLLFRRRPWSAASAGRSHVRRGRALPRTAARAEARRAHGGQGGGLPGGGGAGGRRAGAGGGLPRAGRADPAPFQVGREPLPRYQRLVLHPRGISSRPS